MCNYVHGCYVGGYDHVEYGRMDADFNIRRWWNDIVGKGTKISGKGTPQNLAMPSYQISASGTRGNGD